MPSPPRRQFGSELSLTPAMEDYLKAIYRLQERGGRVTTQALAEWVLVSPASATNMVKRLAERKLLDYEPYHGVVLTALGGRIASEMVRHHRLLELYLIEALGFEEHEVHAEAERLEHFISEEFEERIDRALGHPTVDPHGSPIPSLNGDVCPSPALTLNDVALNTPAVVKAVGGGKQTEGLNSMGIEPGAAIEVLGRPPQGKLHLRVSDQEHLLAPELARWIQLRQPTE